MGIYHDKVAEVLEFLTTQWYAAGAAPQGSTLQLLFVLYGAMPVICNDAIHTNRDHAGHGDLIIHCPHINLFGG